MLGLRAVVGSPQTAGTGRLSARLRMAVTAGLIVAVIGGAALCYSRSLDVPRLIPGLKLQSQAVGALDHSALEARIEQIARDFLRQPLFLHVGDHRLAVSRERLGAKISVKDTIGRLVRLGKTGELLTDLGHRISARQGKLDVPLAATLERARALAFVGQLKSSIDRPASPARLDLEAGKVIQGNTGYRLRVHEAAAAAEVAIRQGAPGFTLPVSVVEAKGDARLKGLDISHVLGEFSTVYSLADKDRDRGFNLKVGASKLDGVILAPKEQMSFNKTVGPRTKAEGYRTAPVISQGELVDGMAGGACQLSSTLFAASFFAGLELLSSRPHTMPSSYIKMGLDAAVAYPTTDLVLANPYPFPVVLHYRVSRGTVKVQIRGKKRPWRKITFARTLKLKEPFKEIIRDDPRIPQGAVVVGQSGVEGFTFERQRLFYGPGKQPVKVEKRTVRYPPVTKIVRRGTGKADPAWTAPKRKTGFGNVPETYTLTH